MTKKIIARLQDGNFVTIFNEDNNDFNNLAKSYNLDEIPTEKCIKFDPEKSLEDDEWFYVQPDLEIKNELILPYFSTISNVDSINPISELDYINIRAICLVNIDEEKLYLTRVFPRYYTLKKQFLKWSDGPKIEKQSASVEFSENIDAIWIKDKLYFKSYSNIKSVFVGLENFYRSATEVEKISFLQKDYFTCNNTNFEIGQRNLRKIAFVLNNINWNDEETRSKYFNYANQYPNIGLQIDNDGKMLINNNQDISKILMVLEERIYTTPVTNEKREANSVTKLINS